MIGMKNQLHMKNYYFGIKNIYLILQIVLKDKGIKHFINLFKTTPVNKKIVNKFIYDLLKLSHKADKGLWSWNEIVELHIDIEDWNQSTLSYVFF
mgnify:CR=1 FL=1